MVRSLKIRGKAGGNRLLFRSRLLGFFVRSMSATETAVLLELQLVRGRALVFGRGIISALALGASQSDDFSHGFPLLL